MKGKQKGPFVPADRAGTIREMIVTAIRGRLMTAMDISAMVSVSEKDVYEHLGHIQRSIKKKDGSFVMVPAACKKCGFKFTKREKLKRPGKCPICRSESLTVPVFSIK